ncbi:Phytanoyl-CoA dioxygenase, peroxisomal [Hondaea fermentalgiana]|uniref:Phytanoyl-CoA dioxygenase, peroxisomal n=1 Tax=Hondaea fermentalgiana TaxID=2315210 RepID=A0A2R5H1B6_9STRA|nr:Phytanoyl-CoA dioxygenase, peroxisomal [Hondaea fermentalgiana]|eukprot:GBG34873.1 Phytanoyl-CoA dioxygenase, peroxisomal [Hondaea fermentalgiana]
MPKLDEAEVAKLREQYERDGFFVVKKLLKPEELQVWLDRFEDICAGKVERAQGMTVMKDIEIARRKGTIKSSKDVTKIQDFQDDPVMFEFCKHDKMLDYVEAMVGSSTVRTIHNMLINKPPDLGSGTSRHPMHQDLHYFPIRPADKIIATWVAMEHIHRDNGCLAVIPGSHKGPLLTHGNPDWEGGVNKLYHGVKGDIDMEKRVYLEMEAGDCVFFHPLLIHGSGRNSTKGFRKAISAHYASAECEFDHVPQELMDDFFAGQDEIPREMQEQLVRESFALRSRQVRGEQLPHWNVQSSL